ncbi:hypothetical protein [Spirochaeta cellobiosiphila]|uniref:hypothetical protein n=1 Tax=Spirochaeta cellobiosiphila TaxID=504483 RepID=UPI000424F0BA|nr:hypothetical protein [Spirochaeta cellobiosiphila]
MKTLLLGISPPQNGDVELYNLKRELLSQYRETGALIFPPFIPLGTIDQLTKSKEISQKLQTLEGIELSRDWYLSSELLGNNLYIKTNIPGSREFWTKTFPDLDWKCPEGILMGHNIINVPDLQIPSLHWHVWKLILLAYESPSPEEHKWWVEEEINKKPK